MVDQEILAVIKALHIAYWRLDYKRFCELLELNPEYDYKYFEQFQTAVELLGRFDNDNIVALVRYGLAFKEGGKDARRTS